MKIVPPDEAGIAAALAVLKSGGVVAHATETCYGLACDLSDPSAVQKLFAIKERPAGQPVSALFQSVDQAKEYVVWNARAEELAAGLPGPLTLVLFLRQDAPHQLFPTNEGRMVNGESRNNSPSVIRDSRSIGVRVSPHPVALALAKGFGTPISTTSANVHGQPNPYSAEDMITQFSGHSAVPDLILDSGVLPRASPSKVVDLTTEGNERILRS